MHFFNDLIEAFPKSDAEQRNALQPNQKVQSPAAFCVVHSYKLTTFITVERIDLLPTQD
jgi:hypothetical protein